MMQRACLAGLIVMFAAASCSRSPSPTSPSAAAPVAAVPHNAERPLGADMGAWLNEQQARLCIGGLSIFKVEISGVDTIIYATANVSAPDLVKEWPTISQEAVAGIVAKMQALDAPMLFLLKNNAVQEVLTLKSDATLEGANCKGWAVENGLAFVTVVKNRLSYAPYVALQFQ